MDTIFMKSENSKISEPQLDSRRSTKRIFLSNLSIYYTWKSIKSLNNNTITINFKNEFLHGMINSNNHMDHILYQILKTVLSIF